MIDPVARRQILGASEVAAVLGLSPYRSAWSVWAEKTGRGSPFVGSRATRRGQALEAWIIAERSAEITAAHPSRYALPSTQDSVRHPDHVCLAATPDAWIYDDAQEGPCALLEVKAPSTRAAREWADAADVVARGGAPAPGTSVAAYWLQVQVQLACVRLPVAELVAALDYDLVVLPVPRDDAMIALIERSTAAWWERYVLGGEEPEPGGVDLDEVRAMWPRATRDVVEDRPDLADAVAHYHEASEAIRAAEERKRAAAARIIAGHGEASRLTAGDWSVTIAAPERETIDAKALRAAHPEIAEQYTRRTQTPAYVHSVRQRTATK